MLGQRMIHGKLGRHRQLLMQMNHVHHPLAEICLPNWENYDSWALHFGNGGRKNNHLPCYDM